MKTLLEMIGLAKATYYEYKKRTVSEQEKARKIREARITVLFYENNQIYGARKLHYLLREEGIIASIRTISADMKRLQLRCCYVKKWREKQAKSTEETLINEIKTDQPVSAGTHVLPDMTYVWTLQDKWVYVITFLDAFTRKVLHFGVGKQMNSAFVDGHTEQVLNKYSSIALLHSDRGSQYTAHSYRDILKEHHVTASYSKAGYPYDNAKIESYHASIKREKLYRLDLNDINDVYRAVFSYNYGFYNTKRIHQSLGYLTPNAFEKIAN
nr:IS3 family transposase [Listeria portnoyi]